MDSPRLTSGSLHERELTPVAEPDYPFADLVAADVYARTQLRRYLVNRRRYAPKIAARFSYLNAQPYSEDYSNAIWSKPELTLTAAARANPWEGQSTFSKFLEKASNAAHAISSAFAYAASGTAASMLVYPGLGRRYIALVAVDSAAQGFGAVFDLENGSVSSSVGGTAAIERYPDGLCVCAIFFTPAAGAGSLTITSINDSQQFIYAGDTAKGFYLGGVQVEPSDTVGPYISTLNLPRSVSIPAIDPADPFAHLVFESKLTFLNETRARVERLFARVPAPHTLPGSTFITRPVMHGIKSGTAYAVSFDSAQRYSHVFTSRKAITRVASVAASASPSPAAMPATNITFVEGGRTLNLAANSSAAATVSAFNATLTGLTGVAANASTGFLSIVWTGTMTSITPPTGVQITAITGWGVTFQSTGTISTPATTFFDCASHGGDLGDRVALWAGDALVGTGTVVSVPDGNSFSVMTTDLSSADSLITHCAFSSNAAACYVNGSKEVATEQIVTFYELGFSLKAATGGTILTTADIPRQAVQMDAITWLGLIIAASTYATESSQGIQQWHGPIVSYTYTRILMAAAVDTVSP